MTALQIGADVPWNAAWSGEDEGGYEIRNCRWVGGKRAVWQRHRPGSGRPLFKQPHFVRQRRSVAQMLCTVCGEPTATHDRFWFGHFEVREDWCVTAEAPVHRVCADHALRTCPVLRAKGQEPEPWPHSAEVVAAMIGGAAVERDFGLRVPSDRPVVGALKLGWPMSHAVFDPRISKFLCAGEAS